jgi:hypothetical protein
MADSTMGWLVSRQPLEIPFQNIWLISPTVLASESYHHVASQQLQSQKDNPINSIVSVAISECQPRSHYEANGENKASKDLDKSWIRRSQTRRTARYDDVKEASKR